MVEAVREPYMLCFRVTTAARIGVIFMIIAAIFGSLIFLCCAIPFAISAFTGIKAKKRSLLSSAYGLWIFLIIIYLLAGIVYAVFLALFDTIFDYLKDNCEDYWSECSDNAEAVNSSSETVRIVLIVLLVISTFVVVVGILSTISLSRCMSYFSKVKRHRQATAAIVCVDCPAELHPSVLNCDGPQQQQQRNQWNMPSPQQQYPTQQPYGEDLK